MIEIPIVRFLANKAEPLIWQGHELRADEVTAAGDVVLALEEARARGERVALLTMDDCGGGLVGSCFQVLGALEAFRASGGVSVAHVAKQAASVAPVIAVAADYLVMDPTARLVVHTMSGSDGRPAPEANRAVLLVLEARTLTPRADLVHWLSLSDGTDGFNFAELDAPTATNRGWCDGIGTSDDARRLAEALAGGQRITTPRQLALKGRLHGDYVMAA